MYSLGSNPSNFRGLIFSILIRNLSKESLRLTIIFSIFIINLLLFSNLFYFSFFLCLYFLFFFFFDIRFEYKYLGYLSFLENKADFFGYYIFISYEIITFLTLIFIYFYFSLFPPFELNNQWLPLGINKIDEFSIPFFNTILLLSSGITVTISHFSSSFSLKILYLIKTIRISIIFIILQMVEYWLIPFDFSSSTFSNLFFLITGFHGVHIIISIIWLYKEYLLLLLFELENPKSILYAHFVDILWIFIYFSLYIF